jgi:hypothetical protein
MQRSQFISTFSGRPQFLVASDLGCATLVAVYAKLYSATGGIQANDFLPAASPFDDNDAEFDIMD